MARKENIDRILRDWPYDPQGISVRKKKGDDGREILQMRLDLGMLQLETTGRPDGQKPQGAASYYDYLIGRTLTEGDEYVMTEDECEEADREFVQYYHRRICWLALREFPQAVADADHTLGMMDFCLEEITKGLDRMKQVFTDYEAEEEFDEDELVQRLVELRESLRQHFRVGRTLQEQLADAIANEKYELAAEIRDELNRRDSRAR